MDAREQLRRYLEQRREMGESELLLDSLGVDEALKLLGVRNGAAETSEPPVRRPSSSERPQNYEAPRMHSTSDSLKTTGGDWREALRATGAAPGPSATPATRPDAEEIAATPVPSFESNALTSLEAIAAEVAVCKRCPLYATATHPVPGEGNPHADLMCVGEAPGATEDETGRPFVGPAGELLTKILEAIQLPREQVFIANVLKHRPPGNRNPLPEEIVACNPFLVRQIELVKPKVILALGSFAAQTLLGSKLALGKLRGEVHEYHGVPVVVTYHPAALLRNPSWKRPTWEDVQLVRRILDRADQPGA
ncbi:MAG: uracil-DNA glycosylase [Gemmatimonadaceae bacterium]